MNYAEAVSYLDSFINYEREIHYPYRERFGLENVRKLLEPLGNPHLSYPTLHVAGTKGKGSTCAFAASLLKKSGLRVGLYTSPHLISFRERIQINGNSLSEEELVSLVEKIRPHASSDLTYFEVVTAAAFLYFAEEKVDAAVIEVGLGGRLDATNVIEPFVSAITPISLDHTQQLGTTLEAIAQEKAGIIKTRVPIVTAQQPEEAFRVFERQAGRLKSPLHRVDQEVQIEQISLSARGSRCVMKTPLQTYPDLFIPLMGRHQLQNAATALRMAELSGFSVTPQSVREGFSETLLYGRCQFIEGSPSFLLDGAHNAASAHALRRTVEELFPDRPIILILGISMEKDQKGMADCFGPWADKLILTRANVPRAESPQKLASFFGSYPAEIVMTASVEEAIRAAHKESKETLVVVTGSFFLVAEALHIFGNLNVSSVAAE